MASVPTPCVIHVNGETIELTHAGAIAVQAEIRAYMTERENAGATGPTAEAKLAAAEALAEEWQEAHDRGGNGRHGYHATEYGDYYAADLRGVLVGHEYRQPGMGNGTGCAVMVAEGVLCDRPPDKH